MTDQTRRRLFLLGALIVGGTALGAISFGDMGENLVYYWDPTQLNDAGEDAIGATVRLGGVVQEGSLDWQHEKNELRFVVSNGADTVPVHATGAPPQMFREGIGVVVEGTMSHAGVFESDRLMVKHSNEYKAPEEGTDPKDLYETVEEI